ncbi:MAG: hydroxyacid dehydrogenase, partial [Oscillospiraceae bacterium]
YDTEYTVNMPILDYNELVTQATDTSEIKYVFSSWGMPALTSDEIKKYLPELKAVFYAAGSVQHFAPVFLQSGIRVFSAWAANAIPVAEFSAAQIILANKGYFQLHNRYKQNHKDAQKYADGFYGNYGANVGLLGAGMIGRHVIQLLSVYKVNIKVFDPFLSELQAEKLGVQKASLDEIFETCQTISNHLANNEATRGMLTYPLFSKMCDHATFINTGRGAQIVMDDLIQAMQDQPKRTALLDVTDPIEPLPTYHIAWTLPNIFLTPHRAGSATEEIKRMGEFMISEYEKVVNNQETTYEISLKMLDTMA